MDGLCSTSIVLFEGFRLDPSGGGLFRLDQTGIAAPISVSSRALDFLGLLVDRQGQLVPKETIMQTVWPGMVVEEGNVTVQISALRRILDKNREAGSCIQTVPGRGYRFIVPVTRVEPAARPEFTRSSGNGNSRPIIEDANFQGSVSLGRTAAPMWRAQHGPRRRLIAAVIGALSLVFIAAVAMRWQSLLPGEARPAPRLSIIVLPFANLSDDRQQQYVADGITEDLTTDLSRVAPMFVISHTGPPSAIVIMPPTRSRLAANWTFAMSSGEAFIDRVTRFM
jgi:DNA-binding winged helix-turn-helix (wHTH) protein